MLASERQLWDQARVTPWKRSSWKGKCQRRHSTSGNGLIRGSISLWHGYVLKWMTKTSLLCLRFGAFVSSMGQEYVGSKTSTGHGPIVQATIKRATYISYHANSEPHKLAMMYFCTFTCYWTRIKNIKNVTRCKDSRSAKSIGTR